MRELKKLKLPNGSAAPSTSEIALLRLLHAGKPIHEIADTLGLQRTTIWSRRATLRNKGLLTQALQLNEEGLKWL